MKIILSYDTPYFVNEENKIMSEELICENIKSEVAGSIMKVALNKNLSFMGTCRYILVEDDYELYQCASTEVN